MALAAKIGKFCSGMNNIVGLKVFSTEAGNITSDSGGIWRLSVSETVTGLLVGNLLGSFLTCLQFRGRIWSLNSKVCCPRSTLALTAFSKSMPSNISSLMGATYNNLEKVCSPRVIFSGPTCEALKDRFSPAACRFTTLLRVGGDLSLAKTLSEIMVTSAAVSTTAERDSSSTWQSTFKDESEFNCFMKILALGLMMIGSVVLEEMVFEVLLVAFYLYIVYY